MKTLPVVPEHTRPGPRESAFMKWGPPPRTPSLTPDGSRPGDSGEFHSGEEQETGSPDDKEVYPLTIEHGDKQVDTPLHSVSWKDESHPMWVRLRTVMDSGAADSVAPPALAPRLRLLNPLDPDAASAMYRRVPAGCPIWGKRF